MNLLFLQSILFIFIIVLYILKNMDMSTDKKVVLIGDIGGTNSRLSLVRMSDVRSFYVINENLLL
jgi:hexokinase